MRHADRYRAEPVVHSQTAAGGINYYVGHAFLIAGLVMTSAVLVWLGMKAVRMHSAYQAILAEADSLRNITPAVKAGTLEAIDTAAIAGSLDQIEQQLMIIEAEGQPFFALGPHLEWLPRYGGDLQALPYLIASGRSLTQAGLVIVEAVGPALAPNDNSAFLPVIAANLAAARPELQAVSRVLEAQQQILERISPGSLSPAAAPGVEQLSQILAQTTLSLNLLQHGPELLGIDGPRTYLILTPNSDELRPAGGYVTTAGHLTLDQGRITDFTMQDSYAVDRLSEAYPYPPDSLRRYMGAEYWVLRDVGWSPHFPEVAQTSLELYALSQEIEADGVISIDQHALRYLVRAMEPLDVEGERVTSENLIPLMRQKWAPDQDQSLEDGEWWRQRKSFMTALADTLRARLEFEPETVNLPLLVQGFHQALVEKHALLYVTQPVVENSLVQQNLAGTLAAGDSDYLMAVSANVGFNKASAAVEQQIDYVVTLDKSGQAQAEATLRFHHRAPEVAQPCAIELRYDPVYEQNMVRCYWNYLRLLVPAQARLKQGPEFEIAGQYLLDGQATTGQIDTAPLATKMSWGQLFLLAPDEKLEATYVYDLPPGLVKERDGEWHYRLELQKQPGTTDTPVTVTVVLPDGATLTGSQPQPTSTDGAVITFQVSLTRDRTISLTYTLTE